MIIGMILDNEFTGDTRVENEVVSLQNAGYKVKVLCFNFGNKKERELYHDAEIIRIKINPTLKNKTKALINTPFDVYTNYWSKKISQFVKNENISVLHVHDLYLLGAAYKANNKLPKKIKIIGDLHENYPAGLKYYKFSNEFPGNLLISIPKWEKTEVKWCNEVDYLITVIEEAKYRYELLGVDINKITVVPNYLNLDAFKIDSFKEQIVSKYEGSFNLLYAGGFDTHRGLESVIKGVSILKEKIPNIKLILVGAGKNEEDLKKLSHDLGIADNISFEGWQNLNNIPSYVKMSEVCLIPHLKTEHTDHTIPHKLFQYMYLNKIIVSSNCAPLERIIKESGTGLIYKSNDENDFSDKILEIFYNNDLRSSIEKKGRNTVLDKYSWNEAGKNLVNLYRNIEKEINESN